MLARIARAPHARGSIAQLGQAEDHRELRELRGALRLDVARHDHVARTVGQEVLEGGATWRAPDGGVTLPERSMEVHEKWMNMAGPRRSLFRRPQEVVWWCHLISV